MTSSSEAVARATSRPRLAARRTTRQVRDRRGLLVLALPSVLWYLIFTIGPLVAMFVIAFLKWDGLLATPTFAGVDNLARLVTMPTFYDALRNTAIHLGVSLPVMMVASFMIGYYLNLKPRGHRILRILMFVPMLISISALGIMFVAVLGPQGLVNSFLDQIGQSELTKAWLASRDTALAAVIGVTIWSGTGFNSVLFAARLAAVSEEIYEAAELDGCGDWPMMWRIAFPICRDYFGVLTMLQYLWSLFGSAGLILILTRGGPGTATTTLSWMVYDNAFNRGARIGLSQAVGLVLFVLGAAGLLAIRRTFRARY